MKILHLDTGTGWRGGQQQVLWLMEGLRERGHQQLLLAPLDCPLREAVRLQGCEVSALSSPETSLANVRLLRNFSGRFDIVHAHDSRAHSLIWLAGISRGRLPWRFLVVSRRVSFPVGIFGGPKHAAADAYIAVSDSARQQLLNANVPLKKIHIVHDGVKPPSSPLGPRERSDFRRRYGVADGDLLLGTLTSISPEKLLKEQIDLVAVLSHTTHLWIGRPELGEELEGQKFPDGYKRGKQRESQRAAEADLFRYAKDRGLEHRFHILPLASDLGGFLDSLDIFLYLSRSEGLGSAILLAMAHGLPVVANRTGGIPEIVRHLETGLLVDGNLQEELPVAVQSLLNSQQLRLQFGAAAREFVLRNATQDVMVAKTVDVYNKLLQGPATNPDPQENKRLDAAKSDRSVSVLKGKS